MAVREMELGAMSKFPLGKTGGLIEALNGVEDAIGGGKVSAG